ncbi:hypothetical protein PISMIDRAFT_677240 [Pisolithus microcarpus 441]|uniref:Uncharacterized protein n=1 Tax=Pisolithus microcarpus 441 TaxID=765257 RepID=A0A0C9Z8G9_9AGAM|nr:hypothetical protein BKA83DRAFT_677240 [Pisolithus microcarpus]KIK25596.1 hypothetical protein PISMIDRAFT_677240 [Pisolithus microcarpus 441]
MPGKSNASSGYSYTGSGTNSSGNHWCSRDYGTSGTGYHYSNNDGSYYYSNPNGSTYYNTGDGYSQYTSPSGDVYKTYGSSK